MENKDNQGLVIRTTGSWYNVLLADGAIVECRLRGNFRIRGNKQTNPIAVGDRVVFQPLDDGTGMITAVDDRRNCIIRRATKLSKQTHVIAANIDLLCIVATLGFPRTSTGFIDRLLVTAEAYHIPAVIIFNKCDLYNDELWQLHNEVKAIYLNIGYPVFEVSALTRQGIDDIIGLIAGKVVLFSGHSGVGKSALLNAIDPSLHLRTGQVSDWSLKGKHTTTFAEIHPIKLDNKAIRSEESQNASCASYLIDTPGIKAIRSEESQNASCASYLIDTPGIKAIRSEESQNASCASYLIDTPGIKEFGMVDFTPEELSHFFPEMRSRLHNCRFANCTHRHEPGCAIKEAVEEGNISSERYQNYLNIIDSIESDEPIRR